MAEVAQHACGRDGSGLRVVRWLRPGVALSAMVLALAALAPPVVAQGPAEERPAGAMPACLVRADVGDARDSVARGEPQAIYAACQGRGLMLGQASRYEVFQNEALRATLVELELHGDRRVLLLSLQDDGQPLLEDLTGQIALAAGRGPMSPVDGVELDLTGFSEGGTIGVRGAAEDAGRSVAGTIDLGGQIGAERARRGPAATAERVGS